MLNCEMLKILFLSGLLTWLGFHALLLVDLFVRWCIKFMTDGDHNGGGYNHVWHYALKAIGCPGYYKDRYGDLVCGGYYWGTSRNKIESPGEWFVITAILICAPAAIYVSLFVWPLLGIIPLFFGLLFLGRMGYRQQKLLKLHMNDKNAHNTTE